MARRLKPTTVNLDAATRERVTALVARMGAAAAAEGDDPPSIAHTLRTALRRGIASLEAEHPAPAPSKRASK